MVTLVFRDEIKKNNRSFGCFCQKKKKKKERKEGGGLVASGILLVGG
jgi:hypothetical protein